MNMQQLSFQRLHDQLLHLIKLQEAFAKDPFVTHFDDCGYGHATVREPEYTELEATTKAYLNAVEVHRLHFDEEYRDLVGYKAVVKSLRERGIDERSIAGEDEIALSRKNSEITSDLLVKPHNQQQKGNL